jgi:hypothetical protein
MIRMALRFLAGAALIVGTFWNLQISDVEVGRLQPREEEAVTVIENQYLPIEYELIRHYPSAKRIGYITAFKLKGTPPDEVEALRWSQLSYIMIPRMLVGGSEQPFVIGHFKVGEPVPAMPENLVQVYDPGTGMILYKQKTTP